MFKRIAAALCAAGTLFAAADAAVLVEFTEVGGNVVGVLSGSLDLTGLSPELTIQTQAVGAIYPSNPSLDMFPVDGPTDYYAMTGPTTFGTGGPFGGTATGTGFGTGFFTFGPPTTTVYVAQVYSDYVSNAPMSGTLTIVGATFADMGVALGDYVWTLANGDTVTLRFSPSALAVPVPAALPLMAAGLGFLGMMRRRAKR